jgi:hypothetical protein
LMRFLMMAIRVIAKSQEHSIWIHSQFSMVSDFESLLSTIYSEILWVSSE